VTLKVRLRQRRARSMPSQGERPLIRRALRTSRNGGTASPRFGLRPAGNTAAFRARNRHRPAIAPGAIQRWQAPRDRGGAPGGALRCGFAPRGPRGACYYPPDAPMNPARVTHVPPLRNVRTVTRPLRRLPGASWVVYSKRKAAEPTSGAATAGNTATSPTCGERGTCSSNACHDVTLSQA
jgi:hypothetical protein